MPKPPINKFRDHQALAPLADILIWSFSLAAAEYFRYHTIAGRSTDGLKIQITMGVAVLIQLGTGYFLLYRHRWRVGSLEEIVRLITTESMVGATLLVFVLSGFRAQVSFGVVISATSFTMLASVGIRIGYRLVVDKQLGRRRVLPSERALVYGVDSRTVALLDVLAESAAPPFSVVGLLDTSLSKNPLKIRNVSVVGTMADLENVARMLSATTLVIAPSGLQRKEVSSISQRAASAGLRLRILPSLHQLATASDELDELSSPQYEDVLGRAVVAVSSDEYRSTFAGMRVLVTGAGGSIGSELCRQIARLEPEALIMLDRDESALHQLQLSLDGRALLQTRNLVVADIRDREALASAFSEHRPTVVLHAAALKHLPLLEMYPGEAVKSNVWGTLNVLEVSSTHRVEVFVNISTDKAADPISVLGYSKRLAEIATADFARRSPGRYCSVRFGNVLGSRGSILTTFREQLKNGLPLTVTDPKVSRYFMLVEESVELILQATSMGSSGEVLVLDMGEPVLIADVAREMIAASGKSIELVFTGLRPGEKVAEVLFSTTETPRATSHAAISAVEVPEQDSQKFRHFPTEDFASTLATLRSMGSKQPQATEV
jgi:FlaA1/EpsC-like NDP-sugar epimerase